MEVSNPWGSPGSPNLSLGHHLFNAEPPDTRYNFVPRPSNDPPQRPGSICSIFESCQLSNLLIHRLISILITYNSIQGCFSTLQHWEENQEVSLPFVLTYTPRSKVAFIARCTNQLWSRAASRSKRVLHVQAIRTLFFCRGSCCHRFFIHES